MDKYGHCMVDLETIGLSPYAGIIAIGAVRFDFDTINTPEELLKQGFFTTFSLYESKALGREIDVNTVNWWKSQKPEVKEKMLSGGSIKDGLTKFTAFIQDSKYFWGNGSAFDLVILKSFMLEALSIKDPWKFRNERDYRTYCDSLPKDKQPVYVPYGDKHNPLDDAIAQTIQVQKVYKILDAAIA